MSNSSWETPTHQKTHQKFIPENILFAPRFEEQYTELSDGMCASNEFTIDSGTSAWLFAAVSPDGDPPSCTYPTVLLERFLYENGTSGVFVPFPCPENQIDIGKPTSPLVELNVPGKYRLVMRSQDAHSVTANLTR